MTAWMEELSLTECLGVAFDDCVGRVALTTPSGLRIVPVNYGIHNGDIIIRTDTFSELGTYGADRLLSFEVDHVNHEHHRATTVVVHGLGHIVNNPLQINDIRDTGGPEPWAGGPRNLDLRIVWDDVTGCRMGPVGPATAHFWLARLPEEGERADA